MKNVQDSEGCKISLISFGTEKRKKSASEGEMWLRKHETPRRHRCCCASNM